MIEIKQIKMIGSWQLLLVNQKNEIHLLVTDGFIRERVNIENYSINELTKNVARFEPVFGQYITPAMKTYIIKRRKDLWCMRAIERCNRVLNKTDISGMKRKFMIAKRNDYTNMLKIQNS